MTLKKFLNIDEALNEKIDCAIIATPPHIHTEISIKCAKSKIHLFMKTSFCNKKWINGIKSNMS